MKFLLCLTVFLVTALGLAPFWAMGQFFSGARYWAAILIYYAALSALTVKAKS